MRKYTYPVLLFSLLSTSLCFSQNAQDQFAIAKELYDKGNYKDGIAALQVVEKQIGSNPKIQSLLVYAHMGNNDFVKAKIELNKYKRMVPNGSSQAHKDLLKLESNINEQLQVLEKNHINLVEATRKQKADDAIHSTYNTTERGKVIALHKENEKIVKALEIKQKKDIIDNQVRINNQERRLWYLEYVHQKMAKQKYDLEQELSVFKQQELRAVKIGQQVWLSENLELSHFKNGDPIFHATTDEEWNHAAMYEIPAWRYSSLDPNNVQKLGKEYNLWVIHDSRGIAPEGWRVPTYNDWTIFEKFIKENNLLHEIQLNNRWTYPIKNNSKVKFKSRNLSGFSAIPTYVLNSLWSAIWWTDQFIYDERNKDEVYLKTTTFKLDLSGGKFFLYKDNLIGQYLYYLKGNLPVPEDNKKVQSYNRFYPIRLVKSN